MLARIGESNVNVVNKDLPPPFLFRSTISYLTAVKKETI